MDVSLDGKVALVTGAGPNIGSGIALMLSKYGAKVACNDVRGEAAEATVRRVERNGGTAMAVLGDVTSEADVARYVHEVLDVWGRIDILVNNAGLLGGKPLLLENLTDFMRAIEFTAAGHFLNSKYVATSMIERGIKGCIWAIVSSSGYQGLPGSIAYAFHKSGLYNFVRAAAMELGPYGIRVNSFTPTAPAPDNPELVAQRQAAATARAATGGTRCATWTSPDWKRLWLTGCKTSSLSGGAVQSGGSTASLWTARPYVVRVDWAQATHTCSARARTSCVSCWHKWRCPIRPTRPVKRARLPRSAWVRPTRAHYGREPARLIASP
jgi:NAD(P)-dependent dehydrogenase (short-subunit alcohol dehydrogenase family)